MLAPVARLLEITPDILLSFQEDVSQEEINQIVQEVDKKFQKEESYESIFQFVKKQIARYPNSERLAGQQGKTQDAYRTYVKLIFQGHNMLEIAMQNIQLWAIEDGNMEKARFMTEKLKNMEFKPLSPEFAAHLKETLQKSAREDESYSFMKGNNNHNHRLSPTS